jgi:hypothetical protein
MRAAIELLLPYLYHPRIRISFLLERLTMLTRARYIVAIYVGAIAVADKTAVPPKHRFYRSSPPLLILFLLMGHWVGLFAGPGWLANL